ncbi:phage holin family protein [Winogradskyella ursingii]|uniref:phage holin family protein n=1 Tax=Winogradskyella ursingii TaxID=2686079 RepID=UPI0015CBE018|nr:phage holin family protein [Winogradskyella ursingii]
MSVFESFGDTTDKATDIGERYIKTSRQYFKLKVFQQLTFSISLLLKLLIIGGLAFVGILFLSVSLAIYIGDEMENRFMGYIVVGLIYLILALIAFFCKSVIDRKIISKISMKFFK